MCGLFGFVDTKNILTRKQKNRLTLALASASAERGTDAAGIAYNSRGKLRVFKRPKPSTAMKFTLPEDCTAVLGHTRMTTQGSEKKNYNNHPFTGTCGHTRFVFAHNGVLCNEEELRAKYLLPTTAIETDSYVAVQLLEQERSFDTNTIANMAEKLEGTFTCTLLDEKNVLSIVKGNNPLCLFYFEKVGLYVYASTKEILKRALKKGRGYWGVYTDISPVMGDILTITQKGTIEKNSFNPARIEHHFYPSGRYYKMPWLNLANQANEYQEDLFAVASGFGYSPEEIQVLLKACYSLDDIAEMMHEPYLFDEALQWACWNLEYAE